jgi:hypothetical protein
MLDNSAAKIYKPLSSNVDGLGETLTMTIIFARDGRNKYLFMEHIFRANYKYNFPFRGLWRAVFVLKSEILLQVVYILEVLILNLAQTVRNKKQNCEARLCIYYMAVTMYFEVI